MKKIRFTAGLLGLAMLGACSSDAPEVITPDGGEDSNMYLAIQIVGESSTRDQTTVSTLDTEENIEKLQIFVLDENENLYFTKTCYKDDIDNGTAKFGVTAATYNDMMERYKAGTQMKVIIYANGTTLSTSDQILHSSTDDPTWGVSTWEGQNTVGENEVGAFIMSNAEDCTGEFLAPNDGDGTDENPWLIMSNIKLARLATRFEYGTDNKDSYTALHESGITMTISGMDVETYASSTYRVSMFSLDGTAPATFNKTNHGHYKESTEFPYRVTDSYGAPDNWNTYTDYKYNNITKTNKYTYKRPNTVSKKYTFADGKEDYKKVPFAVIRAEFKCTNFAGSGDASASMAAGDKVYAVNGIFVGGIKDYKALKAAGKKFVVNYDKSSTRFTDNDKTMIGLVEQNYNRLLEMYLPSETDATKTQADDEKWFAEKFANIDVYKANNATDKKYYTYYASLLTHKENTNDKYWKYGVSRNLSYALVVKSFKWLGNNGEGHPGDGPGTSELSEMAIQLSVEVNKWTANFSNKWDL